MILRIEVFVPVNDVQTIKATDELFVGHTLTPSEFLAARLGPFLRSQMGPNAAVGPLAWELEDGE